jgi:hypothetical protein
LDRRIFTLRGTRDDTSARRPFNDVGLFTLITLPKLAGNEQVFPRTGPTDWMTSVRRSFQAALAHYVAPRRCNVDVGIHSEEIAQIAWYLVGSGAAIHAASEGEEPTYVIDAESARFPPCGRRGERARSATSAGPLFLAVSLVVGTDPVPLPLLRGDFLAVELHVIRCLNTQPHLLASDIHHHHPHIVTDAHRLA